MKLKLYYPTAPWSVNQGFGGNGEYYQKNGINIKGHNGIDSFAKDGAEVRAAHDGVVTFTGLDGAGGLGVVIRTNEEFEYNSGVSYYKTLYWHLKEGSIRVKPDQQVKAGELIALADNTGLSTGSHLHFGLKPIYPGEKSWEWFNMEPNNGYGGAIDPTPYWTGIAARDVAPKLFTYTFNRDLKYGDRGFDVEQLQRALKAYGVYEYNEITGYYGEWTRRAVYAFQVNENVAVWPILSFNKGKYCYTATRKALNRIYS